MIVNALDYLVNVMRPTVEEVGDRAYTHLKLTRLDVPPSPPVLTLHTLQGLMDWLEDGTDTDGLHCTIHVESPDSVAVVGALDRDEGQRHVFAKVKNTCDCHFPFGRWLDPETFTIAALAGFVQDDILGALLKLAGNVTSENVRTDAGDGVTQIVTQKKGAKLVTSPVKNPVKLRQWSTFPEVPQPERSYIFRVRCGDTEEPPAFALFNTDDTSWWIRAVEEIAHWFHEHNAPLSVIH